MGSTEIWRELLAMGDGPDDEFDEDAADALAHQVMRHGDPEVLDLALSTLADADWWRRAIAARVLGKFGFRRVVPWSACSPSGLTMNVGPGRCWTRSSAASPDRTSLGRQGQWSCEYRTADATN